VALNFDICNGIFQAQRFLECRKYSATQCRTLCFKQSQAVKKCLCFMHFETSLLC